MRRRVFSIVAGLLAFDIFLIVRVISQAKEEEAVLWTAFASALGFLFALILVGQSGSKRRSIPTIVALIGLDAVAFLCLLNPLGPVGSEAQEWAKLPPILAATALGIVLTVLLSIHLLVGRRDSPE